MLWALTRQTPRKGGLFALPVLCVKGPALAVHVAKGHPVTRAVTGDDPQSRWQFCFPADQFYKPFFPILAMAPAVVAADLDGGLWEISSFHSRQIGCWVANSKV